MRLAGTSGASSLHRSADHLAKIFSSFHSVAASAGVRHSVSNLQAGADFLTLYRHPLDLCEHAPRRTQASKCQAAQDAWHNNVWMGDGPCKRAMPDMEVGTGYACKECIVVLVLE